MCLILDSDLPPLLWLMKVERLELAAASAGELVEVPVLDDCQTRLEGVTVADEFEIGQFSPMVLCNVVELAGPLNLRRVRVRVSTQRADSNNVAAAPADEAVAVPRVVHVSARLKQPTALIKDGTHLERAAFIMPQPATHQIDAPHVIDGFEAGEVAEVNDIRSVDRVVTLVVHRVHLFAEADGFLLLRKVEQLIGGNRTAFELMHAALRNEDRTRQHGCR